MTTSNYFSVNHKVVFMFTGQGLQYPNMGLGILKYNDIFNEIMHNLFQKISTVLNYNFLKTLYPKTSNELANAKIFLKTIEGGSISSFVFQYALANLLNIYGVYPDILVGHSIGEYVAAALTETITFEDALIIIQKRATLIESLPAGKMLSIPLPVDEVKSLLPKHVSIAADHGDSCIVSGSNEQISNFVSQLKKYRIMTQMLNITRAGHSEMLSSIAEEFRDTLKQIKFKPPLIPFVSTCTGELINPEAVTTIDFWIKHLTHTVEMSKALDYLLKENVNLFLELGPGNVLTSIGIQKDPTQQCHFLNLVNYEPDDNYEAQEDLTFLLSQLKRVEELGVSIDFSFQHPINHVKLKKLFYYLPVTKTSVSEEFLADESIYFIAVKESFSKLHLEKHFIKNDINVLEKVVYQPNLLELYSLLKTVNQTSSKIILITKSFLTNTNQSELELNIPNILKLKALLFTLRYRNIVVIELADNSSFPLSHNDINQANPKGFFICYTNALYQLYQQLFMPIC